MSLQDISATDMVGAGALSAAGFALGYLTPIGGIIVIALVVLFLIDAFFDNAGTGLGSLFAAGLGKIAALAWSPVDKPTSMARRVWLWRAPAIMTLVGFLLASVQNGMAGAA